MALFGAAGSVVSRALVELDIDAHQFDRKLDEADARLREHGNIVGKTLKAGYLAGAGAVAVAGAALVASTKVAVEAQAVRAREVTQLKALGISYAAHRDQIDKTVQSLQRMSGFNDEELTSSFTRLVAVTHNVTGANKDLAIAVDLARARHISLEAATNIVTKASIGQTGALRRMGIEIQPVKTAQNQLTDEHIKASTALKQHAKDLDTAATAQAALGLLQAKYAGQASAYGKTTAGEYDRMKSSARALEEEIGTGVLPVLSRLLQFLVDLIQRLQDSGRAHELLRTAVANLKVAWHDLTAVLQIVWNVLKDVAGFLDRHRSLLEALKVAVVAVVAAYAAYSAVQKVIQLVTAAQKALNLSMEANPIGLVIVALVALGVAFYELYKHCKTFRDIANATFSELKTIVADAVDFVKRHWELVGSILLGPFFTLGVEIVKHFDAIKTFITNLYDWIVTKALKIALAIVEPFSHLPGSMGKWARDAKDAINKQLDDIKYGAATAGADAANAFSSGWLKNLHVVQPNLTGSAATNSANVLSQGGTMQTEIVRAGKAFGVDPQALLAIASAEGSFSGAVGDGGHAFGPFQMNNAGGVLTKMFPGKDNPHAQQFATSAAGITYAVQQIASVAKGKTGADAVAAIIAGFERPGDYIATGDATKTRDYTVAMQYLAGQGVDVSQATRQTAGAGAGSDGSGARSGVGVHSGSAADFQRSVAAAAQAAAAKKKGLGLPYSVSGSGQLPLSFFVPNSVSGSYNYGMASTPSIDAAKRGLQKEYDELTIVHKAGFDEIASAVKPKLDKLKDELNQKGLNKLTTTGLASVKDQMANLKTSLDRGLTAAKAVVQAKKTEFEQAWATFAQGALTAYDRTTQAQVAQMQKATAKAIAALSVTVNGPGGSFGYAAGQLTPAQQTLKDLQDAHDQAARDAQLAADRQALTDNTDPTQQAALQKAIDEDLYQQKLVDLQKQADLEQKAADDALQAAQQAAQDLSDQQVQDFQDQRQIQRDELAAQLSDLEAHLEARTAAFSDANALLAKIQAAGGSAVGSSFIAGLQSSLAAAGLDLTNYLGAASTTGDVAASTVTAPIVSTPNAPAAIQGFNDAGGGNRTVVVNQTFHDPRPAVPSHQAAKTAAERVWTTA